MSQKCGKKEENSKKLYTVQKYTFYVAEEIITGSTKTFDSEGEISYIDVSKNGVKLKEMASISGTIEDTKNYTPSVEKQTQQEVPATEQKEQKENNNDESSKSNSGGGGGGCDLGFSCSLLGFVVMLFALIIIPKRRWR